MTRTALASILALLALGQAASADPQERWGRDQQQNEERHWRGRDGGDQGDFRGRRPPEAAPPQTPSVQPPRDLSGGPEGDRGRGRFEGGGDPRHNEWSGDRWRHDDRDAGRQANPDIDRARRNFGRPDEHGRNEWNRDDWRRDSREHNDWRYQDRGHNDWGRNDWGRNDWGRDHDGDRRELRDRDRGRSWYAPDHYRPYYHAPYRFRAPPYRYPAGWYARQWRYGEYLPYGWFEPYYYLDWRPFGLDYPPVGCEWVRVGQDALLIDIYSGQILSVAYDIFW